MAGKALDKKFRRFKRPRIPRSLPTRRIILFGAASVLFYLIVLSNYGLFRQIKLSRENAEIEARFEELKARESELKGARGRLDDDAELERIAREEYGMVKTGEHVYRIAGPDSSGK